MKAVGYYEPGAIEYSMRTRILLFYQQSPANYYSRFWHVHGVNGKAYGFAYDDVSDQSSTLIETDPEHLELGIGW